MGKVRRKDDAPPVRMFTVAELATLWCCSADKVYDLINTGRLGAVDLSAGGPNGSKPLTRIPAAEVQRFIQEGTHRKGGAR